MNQRSMFASSSSNCIGSCSSGRTFSGSRARKLSNFRRRFEPASQLFQLHRLRRLQPDPGGQVRGGGLHGHFNEVPACASSNWSKSSFVPRSPTMWRPSMTLASIHSSGTARMPKSTPYACRPVVGVRLFAAQRLPWLNTLSAIYRIRPWSGRSRAFAAAPSGRSGAFKSSASQLEPDWTRGVIPFSCRCSRSVWGKRFLWRGLWSWSAHPCLG